MRRFLTSCMIIILTLTISTGPGLAEVSSPNYWANWFSIHPETKAEAGAQVTAVWANTAHLDLFMTGSDGVVWSTWWEAVPGWQPWFCIHSEVESGPRRPCDGGVVESDSPRLIHDWKRWNCLEHLVGGCSRLALWFSIHSEVKAAPGARVPRCGPAQLTWTYSCPAAMGRYGAPGGRLPAGIIRGSASAQKSKPNPALP